MPDEILFSRSDMKTNDGSDIGSNASRKNMQNQFHHSSFSVGTIAHDNGSAWSLASIPVAIKSII
jgi:hypothetical protein